MSYYLPEGYRERLGAVQELDTLKDEWQDGVYREAKALAAQNDLVRILDVGTGSGFKFMKYFGDYSALDVTGVDRQAAVDVLRKTYPLRFWSTLDRYYASGVWSVCRIDLLICADVIEHLDDPDGLLAMFTEMRPSWMVISTPDRDLLQTPLGPPANPHHVREWAFD